MTTQNIPEAAIKAAADAIGDIHTQCDCSGCLTEYAKAALAGALPKLGEVTTEYTVRITEDGETRYDDENTDSDRSRIEQWAEHLRSPGVETALVQRTVIYGHGEWTEVGK